MADNTLSLCRLGEAATHLIDERVGIVEDVRELPVEPGSPNFFHFYARAGNTQAFCGQRNSADAGGAATDRELAAAKAIGEAVERYCSAIYHGEDLPLCSYKTRSFECVPPDEFALYTPEQCRQPNFPYVPFDNSLQVHWTSALDLMTNTMCFVPAAMVFVPYYFDVASGERAFMQPISTGLACHVGPLHAAISAICEVIERDAFTITWQARLPRSIVRIDTLSDTNKELVSRFECSHGKVSLLNLTMDLGVPVILAVLRNTSPDAPAIVFAVAANLDPEEAIRKSLEELAHAHRFCQSLKNAWPTFTPTPNFSNVTNRDSHVALYCDHANVHLADFLFCENGGVDFSDIENLATGDPKKDLSILIDRMRKLNHRILLADVTTDDVRSVGLAVMRAIIPGFHPLCIGHRVRILGGTRLWQVPQKLGYRGITRLTGDNPVPHPVP